jgi:DNA-binding NarL/FixJ family response regulator
MISARLIIVDDDETIREILRSLVEELGAEVVAEADSGRAAIEQAERHRAELMLLDVSMPTMGGFPAARYLREHIPEMRIIFVSHFNQKGYAEEALQLGARGYLVKAFLMTDLAPAIQAVLDGGTFVSPGINPVTARS